jgi:TatD DNase family protein
MAMLNSESGIEIVKAMPSNRVLTETDGPFVKIAGSPQKPTDIGGVLISLSQLWRVAPEEAKRIVHRNFVEATEVSLQPSH